MNEQSNRDFPLLTLSFALSVPRAQVVFSNEPSCNLLWATFLDIISTSYIGSSQRYQILSHVFARCASQTTHGHARIAHQTTHGYARIARETHANLAWPCVSILTALEPMGLSERCKLLSLASRHMVLTRERKNHAELLEKSSFSQILLGWSPPWSQSITQGFNFCHDQLLFMKHLVERKITVSLWNVVSVPCSETCSFSLMVGFQSPNFAQRWTLVYMPFSHKPSVWSEVFSDNTVRYLSSHCEAPEGC